MEFVASPWLLCALSIISFSSFFPGSRSEPSAPPPDENTSLLCISKCDTCPLICSPPPSSPPPPPPPPPDDSSFLCISKCGTCPVICAPPPPQLQLVSSPPPPPGMTYITVDGPSHSPPLPRPPPPKSTHAPPSDEGQKGGLSYPYYYFYTSSKATRSCPVSRGTMISRLFALVMLSFCISLFVR